MPTYEYQSDDGAVIEEVMAMAASKPETIIRDGKTYRRVFGNVRMQPIWKPYISMKGGAFLPGADGHDKQGRSIIGSQKTEREWMAMNDRERD